MEGVQPTVGLSDGFQPDSASHDDEAQSEGPNPIGFFGSVRQGIGRPDTNRRERVLGQVLPGHSTRGQPSPRVFWGAGKQA